jgi:SAM-dependent methyltransferase
VSEPSPWLRRWAHLITPGGTVLDVAAGSGRHALWLAARGHPVTVLDRDGEAMRPLTGHAERVVADIEAGPWPLAGRRFAAVIVANYLWRPLFATLQGSLAEGGVLLYETFAAGNETVGRPTRAEFLLAPGELLAAFPGLRTVAFEDGFLSDPDRFVQRLVAVRERAAPGPARHPLAAPGGPDGHADPAG